MLYFRKENEWKSEDGNFKEIPKFETNFYGIIHGKMRLQTSEGVFDIEDVNQVLYREDKLNFRSGIWYALCTTYNGFQFRIEL